MDILNSIIGLVVILFIFFVCASVCFGWGYDEGKKDLLKEITNNYTFSWNGEPVFVIYKDYIKNTYIIHDLGSEHLIIKK